MQIHVHSPSVRTVRRRGQDLSRTMPVFREHDSVEGLVILDPRLRTTPGRLVLSVSICHVSSLTI